MAITTDAKDVKPKLSKRQKRLSGPNPSNTWPQQPKIKSEAARNKAYLANAGFTTSSTSQLNARGQKRKQNSINTNNRRQSQPLDPDVDVINSPECKFGRLLASPDARIRHATILKLQAYLQARCALKKSKTIANSVDVEGGKRKKRRKEIDNEDDDSSEDADDQGGHFHGLSQLDLLKLWKGLWHTLYLCDGVAVQTEVSKLLAKLMWSLSGSEEQDEYAGRLYLEVDDEDESMEWAGDGNEEDEVGCGEVEETENSKKKNSMASITNNSTMKSNDCDLQDYSSSSSEEGDNHDDDNDSQDDVNIKHCRGAHLSQLYMRTYFQTLTREWYKMDKYRIDKFYTLTRLILRETYRYMAARHWNLGIIRLFNDALFEEVLRPSSSGGVGGGGGNGVRFHLIDICLEELALVNGEEETGLKLTEATFLDCLEPFLELLVKAPDKAVHDRVMENVVHRFLIGYSVVSDNYDDVANDENVDDNEEIESNQKLVMGEVHVGSVAQFIFELASDPKTFDHYREKLYDAHKTYIRRIKEVGRDVSLHEEDDELSDMYEEGAGVSDQIEGDERMIEVIEEDVENSHDALSKEILKKKKRKSKTKLKENRNEDVINHSDIDVEEKLVMTNLEDSLKKPPRKKKHESKNKIKEDRNEEVINHDDINVEEKLITAQPKDHEKENTQKESEIGASCNKKKRKKKKRKSNVKNSSEELPDGKEDVISISVDEQKNADKKNNELKVAEERESALRIKKEIKVNDTHTETPKKVKFKRLNVSKSYKASIKDLKKIDHKAERTPEKSILLKPIHTTSGSSATKKSSASKKKRKNFK